MNKNLRYLFVALMAMIGMNVSAQEVTLDFTSAENPWQLPTDYDKTEKSYTNGGVTITINASNGHKINTNDGYLIFGKQDATLTFSAFAFDVERIDIIGRDGASGAVKQNIFVGEDAVSTETAGAQGTNQYNIAEAKQAAGNVYTLKVLSSHNTQITKILIYKKGAAGGDTPTPEIQEITVAKALEIINALGDGKTTADAYKVKGFVVGTPDFQRKADESLYGNVNFTMADEKGGANLLTVYRAKDFENANFTEETINRFKEGDEVVIQGKLQKYVKNETVTPELTNGYLISVVAGGSGSQEEGLSVGIIRPTFTAGDGTVTYDTWNYIESVDKFNKSADGLTVKFFQSAEIEATIVKDEAQEGGYEIKQVCHQGEKNISCDYVWKLNCTAGGANKHDDANAIGSENWNFGFDLTVADGKAFNVSAIDFDLLVEQNPAYRIRIMKGETEVYNSTWITKTGGYNNKEWGAGSYCRITKDDVSFLFEEKNAEGNAINYQAIQYYPGFEEKFGVMTPLGGLILAAGTYRVIADVDYNKDSAKAMSFDNFTLEGELVDASNISVTTAANKQNGAIYNLAGQKVGKDYKGIVIMNGRKFVVK